MGAFSKVEWCKHTLNFWIGCEKVSEACKHCYAEVETYPRVQRARGRELWGKDAERHITSISTWQQVYKWDAAAKEKGERHRVFVNSLSDFFEKRDDLVDVRARAWNVMRECEHLDFLLLTKRPENIRFMLPSDWSGAERPHGWRNVWLGCTVETQERANERLLHLLAVPAVVHFVSCEPLLGRIDLEDIRVRGEQETYYLNALSGHVERKPDFRGLFGEALVETSILPAMLGLDWVIVGGESGRRPRGFEIAEGLHLLAQTRRHGVACFVKQLGANVVDRNDAGFSGDDGDRWNISDDDAIEHDPDGTRDGYQGAPVRIRLRHKKGGDPAEWPESLRVREFPIPKPARAA